ncbi:Glycosyltransferase family protein 28 isoform 2, partial [Theobroma cacao]
IDEESGPSEPWLRGESRGGQAAATLTIFRSIGDDGSLAVDYFTFSSSIAEHLRSASLVISHAGSGSIFETLRLGKPLIVVVNEDLMDNHQSELAEELAERKHLYCARPQTLHQTIASMDLESLLPYSPGDATPVAKLINRFLGFPED